MAAPNHRPQDAKRSSSALAARGKPVRPALLALLLTFALVVGIFIGLVIAGPTAGFASAWFGWPGHSGAGDPLTEYAQAVSAAAIKHSDYQRKLATIDAASERVQLVTFHDNRELPTTERPFDIWASIPRELRAACQGSADPVRTLKEVLGLSLDGKHSQVTAFEVSPKDLFRPCLSGPNISEEQCTLTMPAAIKAGNSDELRKLESALAQAAGASAPPLQFKEAIDDLKTLRAEYERLYFLTNQMWSSYQQTADRNGFPFTGMGWTYNWASRSRDHVGVSEFVVKRDAVIKKISDTSPDDFCRQPTEPNASVPQAR